MGRLEDVIARNAHQQRRTARTLIWVAAIVVAVVVVIALVAFTDLGLPKRPPAVEKRVDGVLLRSEGGAAPRPTAGGAVRSTPSR